MIGVQHVAVGYERYGVQSDEEYFEERMRETGYHFPITELNWTGQVGRESKGHRVERLEPDFRDGSFFVPGRVWHPGVDGNVARWSVGGSEEAAPTDEITFRACPGLTSIEQRAKTNGERWRLMEPIRRIDEDGNIYDLTRVFFEEYRFFPFSPRDDLIDAISRIYDMQPRAAERHEVVEVADYPDA